MSLDIDDPPNSRLFVVAGRSTSAEFLRDVFEQFGTVSFVKYLRDKGVAYVKYDRASSAALAIETLHEVTLNDGRGPRLKVILADSPHMRSLGTGMAPLGVPLAAPRPREDAAADPDNLPPRSRLFLVVPKSAEGGAIEAYMARFPDLQYCKTDLVASKGIAFAKYARASSAAAAMEAVQTTGTVAGYRVKIMLAEPKVRRSPSASMLSGAAAGAGLAGQLGASGLQQQHGARAAALSALLFAGGDGAGSGGGVLGYDQLLAGGGLPGLLGGTDAGAGLGVPANTGTAPGAGFASPGPFDLGFGMMGLFGGGASGGDAAAAAAAADAAAVAAALGMGMPGFGPGGAAPTPSSSGSAGAGFLSPLTPSLSPVAGGGAGTGGGTGAAAAASALNRHRLFVVLHKSVGEETAACLFRAFPGMEYCDLKRERGTGRSKGYAYVKYAGPDGAAAAVAALHGAEFPPGSGCRMKVMYAEPALHRSRSRSADSSADTGTQFCLSGEPAGSSSGAGPRLGATPTSAAPSLGDEGGPARRPSPRPATPPSPGSDAGAYALLTPGPGSRRGPGLDARDAGSAARHAPLGSPLPGWEAGLGCGEAGSAGPPPGSAASATEPAGEHAGARLRALSSPSLLSAGTSDLLGSRLAGLCLDEGVGGAAAGPGGGTPSSLLSSSSTAAGAALSDGSYHRGTTTVPATQQQELLRRQQQQQQQELLQDVLRHASGDGACTPQSAPALSGSLPGSWHDLSLAAAAGASLGSGLGGVSPPPSSAAPPVDDGTLVYSALTRPLPDFALSHVFSQCGPVEFVRVLGDERLALVKYRDVASARRAVCLLHGTQVLGEVLTVCAGHPASRNSA